MPYVCLQVAMSALKSDISSEHQEREPLGAGFPWLDHGHLLDLRNLRAIQQGSAIKGGTVVPRVGKVNLRLTASAVDDCEEGKLEYLC